VKPCRPINSALMLLVWQQGGHSVQSEQDIYVEAKTLHATSNILM